VDTFLKAQVCIDKIKTPPLDEVVDPEQKRVIIGDTFINCKDEISYKVGYFR
jgi:GMP synthase PP-ATPase subunit